MVDVTELVRRLRGGGQSGAAVGTRGVDGIPGSGNPTRDAEAGTAVGAVEAYHRVPPREAEFAPFPDWVHPDLKRVLEERGIQQLYSHQAEAAEHLRQGRHTVVATPTASGKSLCYQLPLVDRLLREKNRRALLLYPTKALSRDQMGVFEKLFADLDRSDLTAAVYDGDTPPGVRTALRERGDLLITNPWMLHTGILPNHTQWQGMFSGLDFIVVDEVHTLSGVFGSHVANVLRRLQRICAHYGSKPVFCAASATISNPGEHARRLLEVPVEVVDRDGSPRGPKHFLFVNPALVSATSGQRTPAVEAARQLGGMLVPSKLQTIYFTRSRRSTEVLTKYLRDEARVRQVPQDRIAGYRGGYLPQLRRRIEQGLRSGDVGTVVSTSALELGVDIGSLDVCVLLGYPGTVASTFQRAGRVGRRSQPSAVVMIARSFAIDQFLVQEPGWLFDKPREAVSIDPDNPIILTNHAKCSCFELPFRRGEGFGQAEGLEQVLDFLTDEMQVLARRNGEYFYADRTYPADGVSLTAADMDNVTIQDVTTGKILAEVDRASAITEVHEGAIYGHQGDTYLVESFDYHDRRAKVKLVTADYYTEAETETEVKVLHEDEQQAHGTYNAWLAEVHVSTLAKAFKKIKFYTRENVGIGDIDLPPEEYDTEACVLALDEELVERIGLRQGAGSRSLRGVGELLRALVPLFVRVDPGDVRVKTETRHPHFEAPTITLFDRIPDGVGLAERIYRNHRDVLQVALDRVRGCACSSGCPGCVGPGGAGGGPAGLLAGPGGHKPLAAAILAGMLQAAPLAEGDA